MMMLKELLKREMFSTPIKRMEGDRILKTIPIEYVHTHILFTLKINILI